MLSKLFSKYVLIAITSLVLGACTKVPAGNVGVKFDLYGGDKGVTGEVVGPGKYWLGWNEEMYLFPTFTQNYVWTQDQTEGSENNESISFQDKEGTTLNADVGISYAITPDKADVVFQKYRKGVDEITDTYLRNMVRDALNRRSSQMDASEIYGSGRAGLIDEVQKDVQFQVQDLGIIIEKVYWIGSIRLPSNIQASINSKIEATQKALQRENELQTAKAQANIEREKAQGEADARLIAAEAEAKANRLIAQSLSESLVNYKGIERWDGKLPQVTGETVPILNLK